MILIQTLSNFKAQKQGFVINRNNPIMLFTPVSRYIEKERGNIRTHGGESTRSLNHK